MLKSKPLRRVANDLDRRWLSDDFFDLVVWYEPDGEIHGFQLCYDKSGRERSLTWARNAGLQHAAVDTGELDPTANHTPILADGAPFPFALVAREFEARSREIDLDIRQLVLGRLAVYSRVTAAQASQL